MYSLKIYQKNGTVEEISVSEYSEACELRKQFERKRETRKVTLNSAQSLADLDAREQEIQSSRSWAALSDACKGRTPAAEKYVRSGDTWQRCINGK